MGRLRSLLIPGVDKQLLVRDGRLIGHNTDTTGFSRAVARLVSASSHGPVALIGAGGVGKAIWVRACGSRRRRTAGLR